jgi:OOP family OmpA-OmpF porin
MFPDPASRFVVSLILFALLVFAPSSLEAQPTEDVEGAEDHPLISRYEGSVILGYEQTDYDRQLLPAGLEEGEMSDTVVVEGAVTRILYAAPEGLSSLQVHRNYQMALRDAGAEMVFECLDECASIQEWVYDDKDRFFNTDPSWLASEALTPHRTTDQRYFLVRLPAADGDVLVSVYTALHAPPSGHEEFYNQPITILQIVEEKPMPTGKVEANLSAGAMVEDLNEAGTARLYGIHFATDEATIEPESESTLEEIAVLLNEHADLTLAVVGHTDHRGSMDHNMALSRRRAEAVVDYLASEHGIAQSRLDAHGVGPLAPVATNETADGRARNRRVELVKDP